MIDGKVQFGENFFLPGAEHLSDGAAADAYVRPHDIKLSHDRPSSLSCRARVERRSNLGWVSKLHLKLPDGQRLVAQLRNEDLDGIRPGDEIFVDLGRANVFAPDQKDTVISDELAAL